jgi:YbbR domain-containing protein
LNTPETQDPRTVALKAKRKAMARELGAYLLGFCTHNLGLKGISLLLACALWFHVNLSSQELVSETFHLPVQLYNLDDKNLSVEIPPESRNVTALVRGRRSDLIFKQEHLHVGLNLRNVRSPLGEVHLPIETIVPSYFDLQSIEPRSVTVTVRARSPLAKD